MLALEGNAPLLISRVVLVPAAAVLVVKAAQPVVSLVSYAIAPVAIVVMFLPPLPTHSEHQPRGPPVVAAVTEKLGKPGQHCCLGFCLSGVG